MKKAILGAANFDRSSSLFPLNGVVTAGAALSHLDLALSLIRHASPELATLTAKYLVADARTSQAAYTLPDHLVHADPLVQKFELWARLRLSQGFSLNQPQRRLPPASAPWHGGCSACWANRRSPTSRTCG